MKKVFTIATTLFLLASATSYAQVDILAGLGLGYGTEAEAVGIHFRGDVDFNDQWGGSLNITTYISPNFGGEDLSGIADIKAKYWEMNFNAHYFVLAEEGFTLYPLAGLNMTTAGVKSTLNIPFGGSFGATETKVGLNIGGGVRLHVAEQISIMGELKYILSDFDQLVIAAAGLYHF